MNSHGNNLFGFNQESVIGSFSPMASELKASEGTNTIIGDPITQNFGGGPLPKGFPSWSRQAGSDSDEYADMSGWKTFWQSTFAPKKYKENRLNEARASVDRKYSLKGSCSVLEDRLSNLQDEISSNVYSTEGKGATRVSDRQIQALKERRGELKEKKEEQCYVDPEVQQQMQIAFQKEQEAKTRKKNIIAYSIMGVLLLGAGVGAYFMFRKGAPTKGTPLKVRATKVKKKI